MNEKCIHNFSRPYFFHPFRMLCKGKLNSCHSSSHNHSKHNVQMNRKKYDDNNCLFSCDCICIMFYFSFRCCDERLTQNSICRRSEM